MENSSIVLSNNGDAESAHWLKPPDRTDRVRAIPKYPRHHHVPTSLKLHEADFFDLLTAKVMDCIYGQQRKKFAAVFRLSK